MKIQKVTDPAFRRYGKVLEGYNFGPLLKEMKHTPVPEDVVYVPSAEELEALDVKGTEKQSVWWITCPDRILQWS